MLEIDSPFLIGSVGLFYIVFFVGTSILRREGISLQFITEALVITLLIAGGDYFTDSDVNPVLFLIFLYLVTMRSRWVVDIANLLSNQGRQKDAISMLQAALRLYPDKPSRLIILTSMGIVQLRRENPASARSILESVLEESKNGGLDIRYRSACHFNLGLALQQQGKEGPAGRHFQAAFDVSPRSPYGKEAKQVLEQRRSGKVKKGKK